jgi:hypothetical protein
MANGVMKQPPPMRAKVPDVKPPEEVLQKKATLEGVMNVLEQRAQSRGASLNEDDKELLQKFHTPFVALSEEIEKRKANASTKQELNQLNSKEKLDVLMKFYNGDKNVPEILPSNNIFTVMTGDEADRLESLFKEKFGISLNVNFLPETDNIVQYYKTEGWEQNIKKATKEAVTAVGDFIKAWYFDSVAIKYMSQWVASAVKGEAPAGGQQMVPENKRAFANITASRIDETTIPAERETPAERVNPATKPGGVKEEVKTAESAELKKAEEFFQSIFESKVDKYDKLMAAENVDFKTKRPKNLVLLNFSTVLNEKFGTPSSMEGGKDGNTYVYRDFTVQLKADESTKAKTGFTKFIVSRMETAAKPVEMPTPKAAKKEEKKPAPKAAAKEAPSAMNKQTAESIVKDIGFRQATLDRLLKEGEVQVQSAKIKNGKETEAGEALGTTLGRSIEVSSLSEAEFDAAKAAFKTRETSLPLWRLKVK